MRKYELFLVLPGTLDENQAAARSAEILAVVKEKAENAELEDMGKNRLAYPIKQIRYGYFYTITFECEIADMQAIQGKLSLQRDLLRAIISVFNAKAGINKKISYSFASGGSVMNESNEEEVKEETKEVAAPAEEKVEASTATEEVKEEKAPKKAVKSAKKVNLEDINKKLDEILDDDNLSKIQL